MSITDTHKWQPIGEDTGERVYWCQYCGSIGYACFIDKKLIHERLRPDHKENCPSTNLTHITKSSPRLTMPDKDYWKLNRDWNMKRGWL